MMHDAGWIVDVAMTTYEMRLAIAQTRYDCVFINLDQGRLEDFGLDLADYAMARDVRVIMIPDHDTDLAVIAARGWLSLDKPFSVAQLQATFVQALGPDGMPAAVWQRTNDSTANRLPKPVPAPEL